MAEVRVLTFFDAFSPLSCLCTFSFKTPVFSVSSSSFSLSPIYSQNILQRGIEQTLAQIEESSQDSVSPESTQEVAVDAVEAVLERRQEDV